MRSWTGAFVWIAASDDNISHINTCVRNWCECGRVHERDWMVLYPKLCNRNDSIIMIILTDQWRCCHSLVYEISLHALTTSRAYLCSNVHTIYITHYALRCWMKHTIAESIIMISQMLHMFSTCWPAFDNGAEVGNNWERFSYSYSLSGYSVHYSQPGECVCVYEIRCCDKRTNATHNVQSISLLHHKTCAPCSRQSHCVGQHFAAPKRMNKLSINI